MRRLLPLGLLAIVLVGCAAREQTPSRITPGMVRVWQADQAVIALGSLQRAAINMNAIHRCDDKGMNCRRMLSDANTRVVVTAVAPALERMKAQPQSWPGASGEALDKVDAGIDADGHQKLDPYIATARAVIDGPSS